MLPSLPPPHSQDADSDEEDEDYVPTEEASEEDREHKRVKLDTETPVASNISAADRQQAWDAFQSAEVARPKVEPPAMVAIAKRFRFAGEEVVQRVSVPADSEDARAWPLWADHEPDAKPSSSTVPTAPAPTPRPGPRKPKTVLSAPAKPPKLTKLSTLAKSALDWQAHAGNDDDLAAARRSDGGMLDRNAFLERVDERREAERTRVLANSKRKRSGAGAG